MYQESNTTLKDQLPVVLYGLFLLAMKRENILILILPVIYKICSLYSGFLGQLGGEKSKLKYHCQASSPNPATGDREGFD